MINIVLYQPQIPPNTGNVARLCVGINAALHLVRPLGFVLDNKKMKRAGCDYWDHLDLHVHDSFEHFLKCVKKVVSALEVIPAKAGIHVPSLYFLTKHADKKYTDVSYKKGDYLIFGSEEKGFPEEIHKKYVDRRITIPMFGPVRSLNLSNAVSVVAYEAVRQIAY